MAVAILVLIISCAAMASGWNYVRIARRMRSFATTRGTVTGRAVAPVPAGAGREGRWGRGGGYRPVVTYEYVVDGATHTSDRWSYAIEGLKRSVAEQELAAVPNEIDVHYDPADPREAYLHEHTPRLGYALLVGGMIGTLAAVAALVA